jgi:hypothetical protein
VRGGSIFSHDGHLPLCIEVFRDEELWKQIDERKPLIEGLGQKKLLRIRKPDR